MADQNQAQPKATTQAAAPAAVANNNIMFLFAYFLTFISGIIVLLMNPDKRLKQHAFQAIILGGVILVLAIISWIINIAVIASSVPLAGANYPYAYNAAAFGTAALIGLVIGLIEFVIWLYGMYVGYQGMNGKDMEIPFVTNMARNFAK